MVPKPVRVLLYVILIGSFAYFLTETSVYKADILTRSKFYRVLKTKVDNVSVVYTVRSSSNHTLPSISPTSVVLKKGDQTVPSISPTSVVPKKGEQTLPSTSPTSVVLKKGDQTLPSISPTSVVLKKGDQTLPSISPTSVVLKKGDSAKSESKNDSSTKAENQSNSAVTKPTVVAPSVKPLVSTKTMAKTSAKPAVQTTPTTVPEATTTEEPEVPGSCPKTPPGLVGKVAPRMEVVEWSVLEEKHPELSPGGRWQPKDCHARHKVAIIIPYRQRFEHLHIFMNNMHDFLQKQQLDYGIYVIEQAGTAPFNRAMLFNVGYKEAMKDYKWQCIALHDVDHIPLDDHNLYSCPRLPRHMSVAVERFRFRMPYRDYFGGVSLMKTEHYEKINGMSNVYWGWGAEDDDLFYRCRMMALLPIQRYSTQIGSYATIQKFHKRAASNNQRMKLLGSWHKRQARDGLSNLNYTVIRKQYKKLYTDILVNIGRMFR